MSHSRVVPLRCGGTLTVALEDVDVFTLTGVERNLIDSIVDAINYYGLTGRTTPTTSPVQDEAKNKENPK